jgi:predicted CoA-binding protein
MDQEEALAAGVLRSSRTIAVVGASPRTRRHSNQVVAYFHKSGYDVIPVRPDRMPVAGRQAVARLEEIRGQVDLVVIFRRPDAVPGHIIEAAEKGAKAVWLPPGTWSRAAEERARLHDLPLVKDLCPIDEHRHVTSAVGEPAAGHPSRQRVHFPRRRASGHR